MRLSAIGRSGHRRSGNSVLPSIAGFLLAAACAVAAGTPDETKARAAAIRTTAAAIAQESERYAGGDWNRWATRLAPFRADLSARIEAASAKLEAVKADPAKAPSALLRVDGTPPVYEYPPTARYLVAAADAAWARERPAGAAFLSVSRWLRAKNIDLLVVPVPRIPEIYGDKLADGVPPERIVSPPLRRFVFDLLNQDVEVVDLLPLFLEARAKNPEPLYLVSDGHWSDRAQRLAATEIGRRLQRYDVVKFARKKPPLFTSTSAHVSFPGATFQYLTSAERNEVKDAVGAMAVTKVTTETGTPFEDAADSPVVVIGDSFTHYFHMVIQRGTGIDALLSKEINIPVSNVSSAGGTTAPIKDFLRRPELLRGRRVVVWIFNSALLGYPQSEWALPPLPK